MGSSKHLVLRIMHSRLFPWSLVLQMQGLTHHYLYITRMLFWVIFLSMWMIYCSLEIRMHSYEILRDDTMFFFERSWSTTPLFVNGNYSHSSWLVLILAPLSTWASSLHEHAWFQANLYTTFHFMWFVANCWCPSCGAFELHRIIGSLQYLSLIKSNVSFLIN